MTSPAQRKHHTSNLPQLGSSLQEARAAKLAELRELQRRVSSCQAEAAQYKDNDPETVRDMRESTRYRRCHPDDGVRYVEPLTRTRARWLSPNQTRHRFFNRWLLSHAGKRTPARPGNGWPCSLVLPPAKADVVLGVGVGRPGVPVPDL